MTLIFLLIFLNSCAIEQACFTTLVVLYSTLQVGVSQPFWLCFTTVVVLCKIVAGLLFILGTSGDKNISEPRGLRP